MKIIICGDRDWLDKELIREEIMRRPEITCVIHGGATGADTLAGEAAKELGIEVISVDAEWDRYGRAAGPIRNLEMLKLQPRFVLAFHDHIERSKGTKDMLKQAYKAGVSYKVISHQKVKRKV